MPIECPQCHSPIAAESLQKICPQCTETASAVPEETLGRPAEKDHRGIPLPARHAVGGIITPQ
jgi:hypothetical protein